MNSVKAVRNESEANESNFELTRDTIQAMIDKTEKNIDILTDMVESLETDRFRLYSILQAMITYKDRYKPFDG